ncbi:glycosyltransferase family 39 protein [Candidatus Shapirobacteria bacterium]|nr:glycosyltransferase family 39 protein [Candidatus Shapirobacteria bacterium]
MKQTKIFLLLILLLAAVLRIYRIDTLPQLNPDEAALGYNAYSLLKTGKDEHGISYPLHFRSFGDYKPGGYVYLAMPFIKILGLTPLAVRLPNLIFSVLTIFVIYKLVFLLTFNFQLSTLTAFILAVSPWHIHFSRGAWESSTALFFVILGIYLFYSYIINHKSRFFFFSCLSFVASLYVYHSARIVAPFICLFLLVTNFQFLLSHFKKIILPTLFAAAVAVPVLVSFLNSGGAARFGGVGLTADYGPVARSEELLNHHGNTLLSNRITHNRRVLYLMSWAQKYVSHFDLNFLFLKGDEVPRSKSPDIGQLHLIELPLLIIGIVFLLKDKNTKRLSHLSLALLFISPLASSLTFQAPSALRALPMVLPLAIFTGAGLYSLIETTKSFKPHNLFVITVLYIYSIFYFADAYFVHAPQRYPYAWNTGFSSLMPFIDSQKTKYDNIYFTSTYDQPYILYLFFTRYPPQKIQSQIQLTPPDKYGFSTVTMIDNLHFGKINWDSIPPKSLVIAGDEEIKAVPMASLVLPGGTIGFRVYEK